MLQKVSALIAGLLGSSLIVAPAGAGSVSLYRHRTSGRTIRPHRFEDATAVCEMIDGEVFPLEDSDGFDPSSRSRVSRRRVLLRPDR